MKISCQKNLILYFPSQNAFLWKYNFFENFNISTNNLIGVKAAKVAWYLEVHSISAEVWLKSNLGLNSGESQPYFCNWVDLEWMRTGPLMDEKTFFWVKKVFTSAIQYFRSCVSDSKLLRFFSSMNDKAQGSSTQTLLGF